MIDANKNNNNNKVMITVIRIKDISYHIHKFGITLETFEFTLINEGL